MVPLHPTNGSAIIGTKLVWYGMVTVNSLLDKLDPDQVTEILDRLNVEYRRDPDRRVNNLCSHFRRKEANDEQAKFKQHNILFLIMETVTSHNL